MTRRSGLTDEGGFTLVEVLAAVAVAGFALSAIAALVATTMAGLRSTSDRVLLAAAARSLLESMPKTEGLKSGTTSGVLGSVRWRIDVASAAASVPDGRAAAGQPLAGWSPAAITVAVRSPSGRSLRVDTIGLIGPAASGGAPR